MVDRLDTLTGLIIAVFCRYQKAHSTEIIADAGLIGDGDSGGSGQEGFIDVRGNGYSDFHDESKGCIDKNVAEGVAGDAIADDAADAAERAVYTGHADGLGGNGTYHDDVERHLCSAGCSSDADGGDGDVQVAGERTQAAMMVPCGIVLGASTASFARLIEPKIGAGSDDDRAMTDQMEPAVKPAVEPAVEPAVKPSVDLAVEPAVDTPSALVVELPVEPPVELAVEPPEEPAVKLAEETISQGLVDETEEAATVSAGAVQTMTTQPQSAGEDVAGLIEATHEVIVEMVEARTWHGES